MSSGPRYPLYIPSKGRSDSMITTKALTEMGIPHFLIVEPQEVAAYRLAAEGTTATILPLDMDYKAQYELCDDLGLTRSTGPGPARNFAWDHSASNGYAFHWVMDDNITYFMRLHRNEKIKCINPALFTAMEDFTSRYANVAMAGPNYEMFAVAKQKRPPFVLNTRIYSCNLIRNSAPFRWRGRYNEDTILSLDMLKAGWCTIQFNALLQNKLMTQTVKGGNTQEFYHAEGIIEQGASYAKGGTINKSAMLKEVHPDVTSLVWKFGREHHRVDYSVFKTNKLIRVLAGAATEEQSQYSFVLVGR